MAASPFRRDLFAGRHVLVTGGSQGIGLGLARAFGLHGARVTIASRKQEHLDAAGAALRGAGVDEVRTWPLDVRDRPGVAACAQALAEDGGVDVVVNNAAGNFPVPFLDMSENAWDAVVNIVLQGTANVCRSFGAEWRRARRPGNVVNVLAGYAWTGAPYVSHSGAAKAGVMNLTRSLAVEWAAAGVRVNAVSPGPIAETGGVRILAAAQDLSRRMLERVPLARLGTVDEVAQAALFLASDAASYVTGTVLVVDGGMDANSWSVLPSPSAAP